MTKEIWPPSTAERPAAALYLLRAFIRFAHDEVLAAIESWEPDLRGGKPCEVLCESSFDRTGLEDDDVIE